MKVFLYGPELARRIPVYHRPSSEFMLACGRLDNAYGMLLPERHAASFARPCKTCQIATGKLPL